LLFSVKDEGVDDYLKCLGAILLLVLENDKKLINHCGDRLLKKIVLLEKFN
jgi:hypothetical protein